MSFKLNKPSLLGDPKVSYSSIEGFRSGSNDEHNDINYIHSNKIDMTGVPYDLQGIDNLGYSKTMKAFGADTEDGVHYFHPKATKVKEVKIKKVK